MLDRDRAKEETIAEFKRLFGKENPTFDEMRDFLRNLNNVTLKSFDDLIKSRWIWGKNKQIYVFSERLLK